jgi:ubiquinone/menaquinone biosynthesis C-methylase UbiE
MGDAEMVDKGNSSGLETYVIKGGAEGRTRLTSLARALAPSTSALLDRVGGIQGFTVIDAACGGGDVTLELAQRVGPSGRVFGLDLDADNLEAVEALARIQGMANITCMRADLMQPWPVAAANLVYARFILTHLADPAAFIAHASNALAPGGTLVIEDIDMDGRFWHPPSHAMERLCELYNRLVRRNGGDPFIGRRLDRILENGGFQDVQMELVQPFGRTGDAKMSSVVTFAAIKNRIVDAGLAMREEVEEIAADVGAYAARLDTTMSMPRIFQAWGIKP